MNVYIAAACYGVNIIIMSIGCLPRSLPKPLEEMRVLMRAGLSAQPLLEKRARARNFAVDLIKLGWHNPPKRCATSKQWALEFK